MQWETDLGGQFLKFYIPMSESQVRAQEHGYPRTETFARAEANMKHQPGKAAKHLSRRPVGVVGMLGADRDGGFFSPTYCVHIFPWLNKPSMAEERWFSWIFLLFISKSATSLEIWTLFCLSLNGCLHLTSYRSLPSTRRNSLFNWCMQRALSFNGLC